MVEITAVYQGELRCQATHGPSAARLCTDAPVDNHGRGEAFSPTDLVATALGCCMLTILGIVGERHGLDVAGATVRVDSTWQPTRRVASGGCPVTNTIPDEPDAAVRQLVERANPDLPGLREPAPRHPRCR